MGKRPCNHNPIAGGPMPVLTEGRYSFSLAWYDSLDKATAAAKVVVASKATRNGGYFHGEALGREEDFDFTHEGVPLFAVSY
jgi:hypothetical protein